MEDNVSWLPHSNDRFCIWKHRLNHIYVTEALHRLQKPPNIKVSFLNHIAIVLSERGLTCGAVYILSQLNNLLYLVFYSQASETVVYKSAPRIIFSVSKTAPSVQFIHGVVLANPLTWYHHIYSSYQYRKIENCRFSAFLNSVNVDHFKLQAGSKTSLEEAEDGP